MFGKRSVAEDVYATALQRLRDMVKATLPEPECPAAETVALVGSTSGHRRHRAPQIHFRLWDVLLDGRCTTSVFKGMHRAPTSRSIRCSVTEHGITYGARALR